MLSSPKFEYSKDYLTKMMELLAKSTLNIVPVCGNKFNMCANLMLIPKDLFIINVPNLINSVLSDTFKANTLGTRNDNTVMLRYTPQFIKDNPFDVGVGVGQAYYQDGRTKNVFKFETTLRL